MIIPLLHKILLLQDKTETQVRADRMKSTIPGFQVVDTGDMRAERGRQDSGVVVAIGETAYRDYHVECPIKVGDKVSIAQYAGKIIVDPDNEIEYLLVTDEDIGAVLVKGDQE